MKEIKITVMTFWKMAPRCLVCAMNKGQEKHKKDRQQNREVHLSHKRRHPGFKIDGT